MTNSSSHYEVFGKVCLLHAILLVDILGKNNSCLQDRGHNVNFVGVHRKKGPKVEKED